MSERKKLPTSIKELFDSVKLNQFVVGARNTNQFKPSESIIISREDQISLNPQKSTVAHQSKQFVNRSSIDVNQLFSIATQSNLNMNQTNLVGNQYDLKSIESMVSNEVDRPSCLQQPKDPELDQDFGDLFINSLQEPLKFYREPTSQDFIDQISHGYFEQKLDQQQKQYQQQYSLNSMNDSPTFDSSNNSTQSNQFSSFNLAENMNFNFNNLSLTPPNCYLNNRIDNSTIMINSNNVNKIRMNNVNNVNLNRCSTPINDLDSKFNLNNELVSQRLDRYFPVSKQSTLGNETQFERIGMSQDLNMQSNNIRTNSNNDFLGGLELSKNDYNGEYAKDIIDRAKTHRTAAQFETKAVEWRGNFVTDQHHAIVYSIKVFFGGIPWDITEEFLQIALAKYGKIKVEWPGKDVKCTFGNSPAKCGYLYVIFENPNCVAALLQDCIYEIVDGFLKYYFTIKTRRTQFKKIQVIPWILADSNWVRNSSYRLDPSKTIFVGNLHGLTTASNLATIMNAKFENVLYVGIDTDKKNYPSGSARCTFGTDESYLRAISAGFVNVISNKFNKKLQIDPYLSNSNCSICKFSSGILFCRDLRCFKYFCVNCLYKYHETAGHEANPIMRNKKVQQAE